MNWFARYFLVLQVLKPVAGITVGCSLILVLLHVIIDRSKNAFFPIRTQMGYHVPNPMSGSFDISELKSIMTVRVSLPVFAPNLFPMRLSVP
ncbi:hypothetical protein BH11PLA2_BH11PLA2_31350 [soil metagenome]